MMEFLKTFEVFAVYMTILLLMAAICGGAYALVWRIVRLVGNHD